MSNKKSRPETLLDVLRAVEVRERRVRRKTEIQGIPGVACGYRQGDGWIVAYWDWRARCWREYGPLSYRAACEAIRDEHRKIQVAALRQLRESVR